MKKMLLAATVTLLLPLTARSEVKFGGRLMLDAGWMGGEGALERQVGSLGVGAEARRARLFASGVFHDRFIFKTEYEFAGGDADFKDAYIGFRKVPVLGRIRLGHFKEGMGLEELTSSKYIPFIERSLTSTFLPSRNMGVMVDNTARDKAVYWGVGIFKESDNFSNSFGNDEYHLTARLTAVPIYQGEGEKVLHVGGSYSFRDTGNHRARFRARPEVHFVPRFVDTGNFTPNNVHLAGTEMAWICGPFSLQGEWVFAMTDAGALGNPFFQAYYGAAGYFLTGERRQYKREAGAFDRVTPQRPFLDGAGGPGAWELVARFSGIDLNDANIQGGRLHDVTAGVNWTLLSNLRMMFNGIYSRLSGVGDAIAVLGRAQVDF